MANLWGVGSHSQQEQSLGDVGEGPSVRSFTPNKPGCSFAEAVSVSFELTAVGDTVDQTTITIEVSTDFCNTWTTIYTASAYTGGWTGDAPVNTTEGLVDVVTFSNIAPTAGYDNGTNYCFRVNATDSGADAMDPFLFEFDTCSVVPITVSPEIIEKDGGYTVTVSIASSSVPIGRYYIQINGLQCGGVQEGVASDTETVFTVPSPVLDVGGPYDVRIIGIDDSSIDITGSGLVSVVPHLFRSQTLALRQKLSRNWALGYRAEDDEVFPQ